MNIQIIQVLGSRTNFSRVVSKYYRIHSSLQTQVMARLDPRAVDLQHFVLLTVLRQSLLECLLEVVLKFDDINLLLTLMVPL